MRLLNDKLKNARGSGRSGFTLIEAIATILLSVVLIALLLPLMGSGLKGSRRALLGLPETQALRSEMDALWHLYKTSDPFDLPAFSTQLAAAAAADPPPPYQLLDNEWVEFSSSGVEFVPAVATQRVLRVTLGNSKGEKITAYFFADQ